MSRRFLGYGRQTIDDDDIAAVVNVLRGDYLTQGPAVDRFEDALAERVGARHAITVANGTAALHLACLAAGLGRGDTAIVPTLTFVATANAPLYCGAKVVLTDVNPDNRCLTADAVTEAQSECGGAEAVLPVHFAGLAMNMAEIRKAAGKAAVIEDACHALGGRYEDGTPVGGCSYSEMTVFSFHPVKPITSGEGGAITTNDGELARRLRQLRNHGIERDPDRFVDAGEDEAGPWRYQQQTLGFNYRMTDMQAALGLAQLSRLEAFLARRRAIAARYDTLFRSVETLTTPQSGEDTRARTGLHLYHVDIDFARARTTRTDFMKALAGVGIGTQVHYIPVHRQPYHRLPGMNNERFPNAERHYRMTLSIPCFPTMTDDDVDFVAGEIIGRLT